MRDFLNFILGFISSTSLTDDEFEEIEPEISSYGNNVETHDALKALLIERDESDDIIIKLKYYFLAKGVTALSDDSVPDSAQSNILIGAAL